MSQISNKSIFSDMNLSSMLKQAFRHPSFEQKKKLSLDFVENNTAYLSEIMNTCNGRDKLLAIIQYSWGVYVKAMKKKNPMEENLMMKSFLRWKRISSNLSSGRKVFRLLKFSDELSSIIKHARANKKQNWLQEFIFYSAGIWSFFYYFLDNIIWLSSKKFKLLGRIKDLFSLARCLIEIWKSLYEISADLKKEDKILTQLGLYDDCYIDDSEESYLLIRDLIKLRRQMSFYVLELITSILRVFMLYKSLKFAGAMYLDPIFVELWGVFSSFFALLKSIKRKSFEKIDKRDAEKREQEKQKFYEEEKKMKEKGTMDLNQEIMSVDDSDLSTENGKFPDYPTYDKVTKLKSTMSSNHEADEAQKRSNRLKHVKSFQDVYRKGAINALRTLNM